MFRCVTLVSQVGLEFVDGGANAGYGFTLSHHDVISFSARSAMRFFLSLLGTRFSKGGYRPKLMFVGWKFFGLAVVMWLVRAPREVVVGASTIDFPFYIEAA
jgi:hypothetical protein